MTYIPYCCLDTLLKFYIDITVFSCQICDSVIINSIFRSFKWLLWILDTGLFLDLRPAKERCCYKVTPSLIGWAAILESALLIYWMIYQQTVSILQPKIVTGGHRASNQVILYCKWENNYQHIVNLGNMLCLLSHREYVIFPNASAGLTHSSWVTIYMCQ